MEQRELITEALKGLKNKSDIIDYLCEESLLDVVKMRNKAILRRYNEARKNPLNSINQIYFNLSIEFDVGIHTLKKIVLARSPQPK